MHALIESADVISVSIDIPSATTQECLVTGGTNIQMSANMTVADVGAIETVTWFLDDSAVASGEDVEVFVSLGSFSQGRIEHGFRG